MRRAACLIVAVALACQPVAAPRPAMAQLAVVCPSCASQATQLLQYARDAQQLAEAVSMRVAQAQMLQNQITNMARLPFGVWQQIQGNVAATQSLFQRGSQLSLNAGMISSQLRSYTSLISSVPNMADNYAMWSRQANDTITSLLSGMGLQRDQMAGDRAIIDQIRARNQGAAGAMQALQVNTEMGGAMVNELHRLRELIMADAQMQANALRLQADRAAVGEAGDQRLLQWQQLQERGNRRY